MNNNEDNNSPVKLTIHCYSKYPELLETKENKRRNLAKKNLIIKENKRKSNKRRFANPVFRLCVPLFSCRSQVTRYSNCTQHTNKCFCTHCSISVLEKVILDV